MKLKNYTRALLVLIGLSFGLSPNASASHFAGGDLQYRYIGDSTNIAGQYLFILRLYRDMSGIAMPTQVTMYVCSSCFPSTSFVMPQFGPAQLAPTLFDCVSPGAPGTVNMQVYEYRKVFKLPGNCADFVFMTEALNARNGAIDNLLSPNNLIIGAKLNNTLGQNTSPRFVSEPVRAFCVGKNFNWAQTVIEPNGDSIVFSLIAPKGGGSGLSCNSTEYGYGAGWSKLQPIKTTPPNGFTINPNTGNMNFTPGFQEVDVVAISAKEFRFDTVYSVWVQVGEATRDMQVVIAGICSPIAQQGVKLNFNDPKVFIDPATGLPTVKYECLDSSIVLNFLTKLDCSTVSPDGTDFRLTAPDGQPIPIKALIPNCDINNEALSMVVKLHKPLAFNGYYYLYSKIGNDGNTLANKCGFPMGEFDTIQLFVEGCFQTEMDIKNVSVIDDEYPRIEWLLDTIGTALAPFPKSLVDEYKVLRKDPGAANYNVIYTLTDYKSMVFNDKTIGGAEVDLNSYEYKVEVVVNGSSAVITREIASILLKSNPQPIADPTNVDLHWNAYIGWPAPEYTMHLGTKDQNGNWVDVPHVPTAPQTNPTSDTIYNMVNKNLQQGDYRICVLANFPGGSGPYQAWSNCIPFTVLIPPPPPPEPVAEPKVPNVFSPNNDGNNDFFTIENLMTWNTTRSVRIFNRWGNIVYDNDMYDNNNAWDGKDQSGKKLADGVYFYMIDLYDQATGERWNGQGQVSIFGSN